MTTIRRLVPNDYQGMLSLVQTRSKFMGASPLGAKNHVDVALKRMVEGDPFLGIFLEDTSLDGFVGYRVLEQNSPRADDFEITERAALVHTIWSRKRPDRAKHASGQDILMGDLMVAVVQDIEAQGIYTFWTVLSSAFTPFAANDGYASEAQRRVQAIGAEAAAGDEPVGPLQDYVRANIMPRANPIEGLTFRVNTLRDEFRPAT